eukprot:SAG31_NODE_290_length_18324_cov_33.408889_5_plen_115_part_00
MLANTIARTFRAELGSVVWTPQTTTTGTEQSAASSAMSGCSSGAIGDGCAQFFRAQALAHEVLSRADRGPAVAYATAPLDRLPELLPAHWAVARRGDDRWASTAMRSSRAHSKC